jgi:hypothetical protein
VPVLDTVGSSVGKDTMAQSVLMSVCGGMLLGCDKELRDPEAL